jgi:hypothetical protein
MAAKYKTVRRNWLDEDQARTFVAAAQSGAPVRFDRRCWEIVEQDGTVTGAMTVFRLRLLPEDPCQDAT